MKCNNCGLVNRVDAQFCQKCGSPLLAKPAPQPAAKKSACSPVLIAVILFACIGCAILAAAAFIIINNPNGIPIAIVSPGSTSASVSDQQMVASILGQPSFFILNMAPSDTDPNPTIHANWFYPNRQVSYTFIDGVYVGSNDMPALPSGLRVPSVRPDQFRRDMSATQVNQVIGAQPVANYKVPASVLADTEFNAYPGIEVAFQKGRLVYVKTYPYDSVTSEQLPVPSHYAPIQVTSLSYQPGASYSRLTDSPVALAPDPKSIVDSGKEVFDWISVIKDTADLAGAKVEIQNAARFLREQQATLEEQAKSETDPIKKATLLNAANLARQRANGIENDVIPTLRAQERGFVCQKFKCPDSMLPYFGGEKPDPDRLRQLFQQYLSDLNARPGQVRATLQQWLTDITGNWNDLPPAIRESVITSIVNDRIREMCDKFERNTDAYRVCKDAAINTLRGQFSNFDIPGNKECFDELTQRWRKSAIDSPRVLAALVEPRDRSTLNTNLQAISCPPRGTRLAQSGAKPTIVVQKPSPTTPPSQPSAAVKCTTIAIHFKQDAPTWTWGLDLKWDPQSARYIGTDLEGNQARGSVSSSDKSVTISVERGIKNDFTRTCQYTFTGNSTGSNVYEGNWRGSSGCANGTFRAEFSGCTAGFSFAPSYPPIGGDDSKSETVVVK